MKKYAVCAIPLMLLVLFIALYGRNVPHMDDIAIIDMFEKYHSGTLTAERFFRPHNQHVMPVPNLIFLGAGLMSDFNLKCYLYISAAFLAVGFIFLIMILSRVFKFSIKDPPWWVVIVSLLHFSLIQYSIFLFGFNLSYILPLVFFYGAILFAMKLNAYDTKNVFLFILTILFMAAGMFSSAMGYFAIPAILLILLFNRNSRSYIYPLLIISGLLLSYILSIDYRVQESSGFDIVKFQEFFFQLTGLPVYMETPAYISGIISVVVFVYLIYLTFKHGQFKENIIFISIILYCTFILLSIAYGRHNHEEGFALAIRYNAYKIPLYISFFLIFINLFRNKKLNIRQRSVKIIYFLVIIFYISTTAVVFYRAGPNWVKTKEKYACIILNYEKMTDEQLEIVYPRKRPLIYSIKIMKKYELSVFSNNFCKTWLNCDEVEYTK